jgi:putative endonuclease
MKVYLYILQSRKDDGFYVGISSDPHKRLEQHNSGDSSPTKNRTPFILMYMTTFNDYKEARRVEKILKKYTKAKILRFIDKVRIHPN